MEYLFVEIVFWFHPCPQISFTQQYFFLSFLFLFVICTLFFLPTKHFPYLSNPPSQKFSSFERSCYHLNLAKNTWPQWNWYLDWASVKTPFLKKLSFGRSAHYGAIRDSWHGRYNYHNLWNLYVFQTRKWTHQILWEKKRFWNFFINFWKTFWNIKICISQSLWFKDNLKFELCFGCSIVVHASMNYCL